MSKSRSAVIDTAIYFTEPSMTHQEFQDSCDIRNIMTQYKRQGLNFPIPNFDDSIMDVSDVPSYHEAMNTIIAAQHSFDSLPSSLRKRFGNDPGEFLEFVKNPDNLDEMVKLGICERVNVSNDNTKTEAAGEADPSST